MTPTYKPSSRPPKVTPGKRIGEAADVWAYLYDVRDTSQEHFVVFSLNVRYGVIQRRVVHIGTLAGVEVHPREVFRPAIIDNAAAVILAHNHPSGDPTPSRQDIELTARLRHAGELLGVIVLDHVVVAAEGWVSLSDRGWQ